MFIIENSFMSSQKLSYVCLLTLFVSTEIASDTFQNILQILLYKPHLNKDIRYSIIAE